MTTSGIGPLAEPTQRVGKGFIAVLALTNLGIWTGLFTPIQFLLPLQVEAIDPVGKKPASGSLLRSARSSPGSCQVPTPVPDTSA